MRDAREPSVATTAFLAAMRYRQCLASETSGSPGALIPFRDRKGGEQQIPSVRRQRVPHTRQGVPCQARSARGAPPDLPDQRQLGGRHQRQEPRPAVRRERGATHCAGLRAGLPLFQLTGDRDVHPGSGEPQAVNADQLEHAWAAIPTPDSVHQLEAVPVTHEVWAGVDHEGRRHLLLQVPEGTEAPPIATRGLRATVAQHQVRGQDPAEYLDLACLSDDVTATFTAVAADIGSEAGTVAQTDRVSAVVAALSRWQWFWGVEAGALTPQDVVGLFAELWFLHRWTSGGADAVDAWTASAGSRHDFQWPDNSVEVKAATRRADGAVLHRIHHLDQLSDPEEGQLLLFSLVIVRDQLAHNTLPDLADRISSSLHADPHAHDEFTRKLGLR